MNQEIVFFFYVDFFLVREDINIIYYIEIIIIINKNPDKYVNKKKNKQNVFYYLNIN